LGEDCEAEHAHHVPLCSDGDDEFDADGGEDADEPPFPFLFLLIFPFFQVL
jgi:hypothetical protein